MLAALQGWTNETIDRAILDPDMQKEMLEALRLSGEGACWTWGTHDFAEAFITFIEPARSSQVSSSTRLWNKVRSFKNPRDLLDKHHTQKNSLELRRYLNKKGVDTDNLSHRECIGIIVTVWTEPGSDRCDNPWKDAAEQDQKRSAERRENARRTSWISAAYPTYTAAQQPAKEFLAMLPTEDFLAMYQKICKVDCPANGNIESSASVSQPPTDSVDVMDMRTASLSTADRAKMERNLLRSAQSPHDFLASIKLPLLTGFLQKKGIDVAALQGHLKRTSDWVNIILTKWQNKDATLQAASEIVLEAVKARTMKNAHLKKKLDQMQWDMDNGRRNSGARVFLQGMKPGDLKALSKDLLKSDPGSLEHSHEATVQQLITDTSGPGKLLMSKAFTPRRLSAALLAYRCVCEDKGMDSSDKVKEEVQEDASTAHLQLQFETVLLWQKYGDPKVEAEAVAAEEHTDKEQEEARKAAEERDEEEERLKQAAQADTSNQAVECLHQKPGGPGSLPPTVEKRQVSKKKKGEPIQRQPSKEKKKTLAAQATCPPESSVAKVASMDELASTNSISAQHSSDGAEEGSAVQPDNDNEDNTSSKGGAAPFPFSDSDAPDTNWGPKEDPWDIMQDIVDQAQLVYFCDFDKVVRREVLAQNALKQRLKNIGYVAEDEVRIASRILDDPEKELDRVDLLVNDKVLVELKLANNLSRHENQLRGYMNLPKLADRVQHGVLIGFPDKTRHCAILAHSAHRQLNHNKTKTVIAFQPDYHPSLAAFKECLQV
ncbi:MAG: hypothetical protein FRX49_04136 [Trebouxia sp. A1-2]|nr:MAG: hypothetical protein FRX49_04136 [Trebouxia sp. A1-2]